MDFDVAIVGGGFAGLAAARELAQLGYRIVVVEAAERLGGRAFSLANGTSPVPMELGAEFVHGRPEVTLALMRATATTDVDCGDESWKRERGVLDRSLDDPFSAASDLFAHAFERERDESVDALLTRLGHHSARDAAWSARSIVAAFDAADPARASARAIATEWSGEAAASGAQSRPLGGYAPLVSHLQRFLDAAQACVVTSTIVRAIRYGGDGVTLDAAGADGNTRFNARRAIVTLPLGVLQAPPDAAGAVAFEPPLPADKRAALGKLIMGPVRKVILRFSSAFWEELERGRYRDAAFFADSAGVFPVYWTQVPVRAPIVVAWAGGPAADALAGNDDETVATLAREGFGALLGAADATNAAYAGYATYDWQRDVRFRGAYSYVAVAGEGARATLARPIAERVYFAGEATAQDSEGGTVAGALQSGIRAAREVHEAARVTAFTARG